MENFAETLQKLEHRPIGQRWVNLLQRRNDSVHNQLSIPTHRIHLQRVSDEGQHLASFRRLKEAKGFIRTAVALKEPRAPREEVRGSHRLSPGR
jgi:hypothetical protein